MSIELDPIKYEVVVRRLLSALEEGRQAVAMISGSPAIVEGGEFMTSLYEEDGAGILTAAGTLFHVMGSADAIRHATKEYEDNPGINDGDQFFYNDPYIAGTHVFDQIVIKPIFYGGRRVAWVGTMTHTGDVGGILRGASTEIFHEGVRIRGLKIFEAGKIRKDALGAITQQCRDPEYVAQDILARIVANNVCTDGYLRLLEKFGIQFIKAACRKLREDAERMFREKLKRLPDGTWRERIYMSRTKREKGKEVPLPLRAVCTMTKEGDQLTFDAAGSSPQTDDYFNAALPCSRSCLFAALAAALLWDIPWNSDVMEWVNCSIPEGTFINCRFPASCGLGTRAGQALLTAAAGCIAKMMYAAGNHDYVNASWGTTSGAASSFGPGTWYGGHDQKGRVAGSTYQNFAGANGATPHRDGNDTGGIYVNARSAISNVEWIETYFPFLFFSQRHGPDSGGYGKFRGGMNLENVMMVYGTQDLTADYLPGPEGGEARGFGLFGGYPMGGHLADAVMLFTSKEDLLKDLSKGVYPTTNDELGTPWGINVRKSPQFHYERQLGGVRVNLPEYSLIGYSYGCGGGYGDPLDRDPERVLQDVKNGTVTLETATKVYGVVINSETMQIHLERTEERRREIRRERLSKGERLTPGKTVTKVDPTAKKATLARISEYLEIVEKVDGSKVISCIKCGKEFCAADDNYKKYSLRIIRDLRGMKKVSQGEEPITHYQEYICPGCETLLQVDVWCSLIDTDEPLWDIDISI